MNAKKKLYVAAVILLDAAGLVFLGMSIFGTSRGQNI